MALRLVRKTSDTPNITNKDDTIMTRYAYGGKNGIVKNFGRECNLTFSNGKIVVESGRIVLCGWEIDIDAEGWSLDVSKVYGTQYHTVYIELNVATETAQIKSAYLTGDYPALDKGDDLTEIPNGTARELIGYVDIVEGSVTGISRVLEVLPYGLESSTELESRLKSGGIKPKIANIAEFASEEPKTGAIVKQKKFALTPMTVDEAIEEMELLGHNFYVFKEAKTNTVQVLYLRKDGDLGLIEPEI